MLVQKRLSLLLAIGLATATPIDRRDVAWDFANEMVRGVNLGGWLVLEPWITPSIFQAQNGSVVDEWTLCEMVPDAVDILKQHWDTWATLADFQKIAASGFNTVRIPIGYWAYLKVPGDPYVQGAAPYIDSAISWARQTGLKVWIDLHGVPGSQNGFDNSGHRIPTPGWEQGDTIAQTRSVIQQIASKYAQPSYNDVVVALELVNEPLASELQSTDTLRQFYVDGYNEVRKVSNTPVMLHDAFEPSGFWNDILEPQADQYVIVDHHEYQVFTNEFVALPDWAHRQRVCNNAAAYTSNESHWLVIGEWTAAMTDCAPALNGYQIGARYDGTYPSSKYVNSCGTINDIDTWSQTMKDDTRGYIEAQLEVFEQYTRGWVFWNFKTEASAEWDAFRLIDAGVFPQPLTSRKFSQICSF
ncbi:exo-1,3-beta-glucanase [Schaereria dolodes]|nr:exo-1,3-beta-glucanase [Schaereria dolodes]